MGVDPRSRAHLFGAIAAASVRRRWYVVVVWLLVAAGSIVLSVNNLGINTDTTDMLSPELDFRKQFMEYRRAFPHGKGSMAIVVTGPTSDLTDHAARRLAISLQQDTNLFRSVFFPQGDRFFRRNGLLYLSLEDLEDLSDRLIEAQPILGLFVSEPNLVGLASGLETILKNIGVSRIPTGRLVKLLNSASEALEAAATGSSRPVDWGGLLGVADGDRTVVIVTQPVLNFSSLSPASEAMAAARAAAVRLGITSEQDYAVRLTGSAAISSEEISSVSLGAGQASLMSLALIIVLLFAGLRQLWAILAVTVTLLAGLATTLGFVTLAVGELNLISVAFAVLFIGLGVDFAIHAALRASELAPTAHLFRKAAESVGPALALSAAAAALAFLSFLFTDYRGVAELGLIAAVGMAIALAASLSMLPALESLRPVRSAPDTVPVSIGPRFGRMDRAILVVAAVLALTAAVAAPFVEFDSNPLNLKDQNAESVQTAAFLADHPRYGLNPIQVLAQSQAAADAVATRLRAVPEVRSVRTLGSFLPTDQEGKQEILEELYALFAPIFAGQPAFGRVDQPLDLPTLQPSPERVRAALAGLQKAAGYAAVTSGAPPLKISSLRMEKAIGRFIALNADAASVNRLNSDMAEGLTLRLRALAGGLSPDEVTVENLPVTLRDRYRAPDGVHRIEVFPHTNLQDNRVLKAFVAAVRQVAPTATGAPVVEFFSGNAVITAFLLATGLAAVFILALLVVVLRRIVDVFLVLAPVALAGLLTLGTVVLLGPTFNFANVIALPLLIGLGAAGGIHIVLRWRRQETVASFGTLAVSPHRGTASMGELLMIAIGWSLICSLVVLPAALRMVDSWRSPDG
ncbi:MAG: MMPL family transporter [Rhodospirillaceae bacterium]|nr:MMPL family transporter [Rhodospirillaceae bacterium]